MLSLLISRESSLTDVFGPLHSAGAASAAGARGGSKAEFEASAPLEDVRGSNFLLRRGPLLISSKVNRSGSQATLRALNLPLDELEIGSLRGELQVRQLA